MIHAPVGVILILGIVMVPVYVMLLGWFFGSPRSTRLALTGVGYLVSITVGLWAGLAAFALLLGLLFF
ncbi:MAG TPA: hypothetical protein VNN10_15610 [Dehalococcoidia bacterium]|nr:hypothetical protein [Dehalococcoidia bacterium]